MSLVPAYAQCTAPNRTHGTPLSYGSCKPPAQTSSQLTVGTPDANGWGANSQAYALLGVVPGDSSSPPDEANVGVRIEVSDVRRKSDLSDYAGQLRFTADLRITDKDNTPHSGGPGPGTVQDFPLSMTLYCASTVAFEIGGNCTQITTLDAYFGGVIKEGRRAIWQLGQTKVYDGGADGDASTQGDDTLFMTQGVFVP
jgi:hypothetical protein